MSKPSHVHAEWDEEAQVWVAVSDAVRGLAIEAATTETLIGRLSAP